MNYAGIDFFYGVFDSHLEEPLGAAEGLQWLFPAADPNDGLVYIFRQQELTNDNPLLLAFSPFTWLLILVAFIATAVTASLAYCFYKAGYGRHFLKDHFDLQRIVLNLFGSITEPDALIGFRGISSGKFHDPAYKMILLIFHLF